MQKDLRNPLGESTSYLSAQTSKNSENSRLLKEMDMNSHV